MATLRFATLATALAAFAGPASADDIADKNLSSAVIVEWMVAHCDQSKIPAATVGVSAMVINATDAEAVKAKREAVKRNVAENSTDTADACAKLFATMK